MHVRGKTTDPLLQKILMHDDRLRCRLNDIAFNVALLT
jgi:hypothetical protein